MKPGPRRRPLAERLWTKVAVAGPDDCWPFTGTKRPKGYGQIGRGGDTTTNGMIGAHVAAWIVTFGDVPAGSVVRHTCDNPPCCNPRHLKLGSVQDNQRDSRQKGRAHFQRNIRDSAGRFARVKGKP